MYGKKREKKPRLVLGPIKKSANNLLPQNFDRT